jgi:hypothetical protein
MKFFLAMLLWFLMAAILVVGCVLAVKGSFWLLIIGVATFFILMGKIGCLTNN